jgi:hypothetical protein
VDGHPRRPKSGFLSAGRRNPADPLRWRLGMRPFVRSQGGVSTWTRSPVVILMKCFRILPDIGARISCPFSRCTRYIVVGSNFDTMPSTFRISTFSIASGSFQMKR